VLLCLSSTHHNASFGLLERLSLGASSAARVLVKKSLVENSVSVRGAVVLATCNRFEVYLDIDGPPAGVTAVAIESTLVAIGGASGIPVDELRTSMTVHQGNDVAEHLFAVSSGLESVVVGEDEISGQVRRALDTARTDGTTSRDLERLFQRATHITRGVKNKTAIGAARRSVVRLALELASSRIADWSEERVLIIGTGRYAVTTVAALRTLGVRNIRVFSPSERSAAFAAKHGLVAETTLKTALKTAGIVITCTTTMVVRPDAFTTQRRRIVIDLGLPRNVDPAVANIEDIELLDLETINLHAPIQELTAHHDARAIIGDAAAEFSAAHVAGPAIAAMRRHVFDILEAEIARARSRTADPDTEAALRHLAGALLHGPSVRLRQLAREGRIDELLVALDVLYDIHVPHRLALSKRSEIA
jgi:glutamyl-tRNA reductase